MQTPLEVRPRKHSDSDDDDATDASTDGGRLRYGAPHMMAMVKPVSITMLTVASLVSSLRAVDTAVYNNPIMSYKEKTTDASGVRLWGAARNGLQFTIVLTVFTSIFYVIYKYRWIRLLDAWMCLSVGSLLGFTGGALALTVIKGYALPIDCISFAILLWNFAAVGVCAIFWRTPLRIKQAYLCAASVIMAWLLTHMPEWTNLAMLFAVSCYDIVAVLSPVGPLKALVELSQAREETIPGLVYEDMSLKLGIGDFVFYSVLLGRAVLVDFAVAAGCFVAILTGLCSTLLILSLYKKALPALPLSVFSGLFVLFSVQHMLLPLVYSLNVPSHGANVQHSAQRWAGRTHS